MTTDFLLWGGFALLGLVVGSFLNVVIHRLPRMLEAQWAEAIREQGPDTPTDRPSPKPFNIAVPRSHCPHCGHVLSWSENIPVLSYLVLKGRCSQCHSAIASLLVSCNKAGVFRLDNLRRRCSTSCSRI